MSKLVKLFGLLMFSDALNADYVVTQRVSDEEMARAVFRSVFGPGSQDVLKGEIQKDKESKVADKDIMQKWHDESVAATVIFKKGFTAKEVEVLAGQYQLELAAAQAKVSTYDDGTVLTLSIGCAVLLLLEKSYPLSTRLDLAIGKQQQILLGAEAVGRDNFNTIRKTVNTALWRFYRVDVIARESQLATLLDESNVAAVSVDRSGSVVADYNFMKQRMSQLELSSLTAVQLDGQNCAGTCAGTKVAT